MTRMVNQVTKFAPVDLREDTLEDDDEDSTPTIR